MEPILGAIRQYLTCHSAGGSKGRVQVFDLQDGQEVGSYPAAADTVNGFQFHPFLPLAATASGRSPVTHALAGLPDDMLTRWESLQTSEWRA